MSNVVEYSSRSTVSSSTVGSGSGGGDVEDILRRLGNVETSVSEVRTQVSAILAVMPHLATKADVADVRSDMASIPHLATKADVADVRSDMASMEAAIIKWIVATVLASAGLAFTIAKFVH
jgi:hypothetical protein